MCRTPLSIVARLQDVESAIAAQPLSRPSLLYLWISGALGLQVVG